MLRQRIPIGTALIAAIVGGAWLDQWVEAAHDVRGAVLWPAMALIGFLASMELAKMFRRRGILVSRLVLFLAVLAGLLTSGLTPDDIQAISGIAFVCTVGAGVLIGSLVYFGRGKSADGATAVAGATLLAFVYLGVMGGFLIVLRREHTAWLVLAILLVTKSSDIGAYFVGSSVGRTKLIQWLSPKKTWEGFFGGLALATVIGSLTVVVGQRAGLTLLSTGDAAWWEGAIAGLLFGAVGQAGDLVASMLKRDAGIKDSSSTIPGFGGVLDIIDSPILVAPAAYWLTKLQALPHAL